MYIYETTIRVRYAETDKMGYVYYSKYAEFYEVARTEAIRNLGIRYRDLEDQGVMMPVLSLTTKYIKPAFYDDNLLIKVFIKEMPTARIKFYYKIYNEKNELINTGETVLVFIDRETMKPCNAPETLIKALMKYIN